MATDEEYLDNLLKSMMESESQSRTMDEVMEEMRRASDNSEVEQDSHSTEQIIYEQGEDKVVSRKEAEAPVSSEDLADMLDQIETRESLGETFANEEEESLGKIFAKEAEESLAEVFAKEEEEIAKEDTQADEEDTAWQEGLDEILHMMEEEQGQKGDTSKPESESGLEQERKEATQPADSSTARQDSEQLDVTALIDGMENADEDLLEISDLLKKSDNNEAVTDDMLDLLGSINGENPGALDSSDSGNTFLTDQGKESIKEKRARQKKEKAQQKAQKAASRQAQKAEKKARKDEIARKKKEEKGSRKGKRSRTLEHEWQELAEETPLSISQEMNQAMQSMEDPSPGEQKGENNSFMEADLSELLGGLDLSGSLSPEETAVSSKEDAKRPESAAAMGNAADWETEEAPGGGKGKAGKKKKASGVFARIMEFLTREDAEPEETVDENTAILQDLEEEDQEQASKKGKKKKKKKGGKDQNETQKDGDKKGKKGKKPKKEKKPRGKAPKEKKQKAPEAPLKPARSLSKKNLIVLTAFCVTVFAAIYTLTTFIPEYANRDAARKAFYQGDYETVYQLLYDKKRNNTEEIMYNRARLVFTLERRIASYENNQALGRELEAVDSLVQGIRQYDIMTAEETYGAEAELQLLYQQICDLLEQRYGLTPEKAREINYYESGDYTKYLSDLIQGKIQEPLKEAGEDGQELREDGNLPDLLPEEEEMRSDSL